MKSRRYLALLAGIGLFAGLQVPASAHPAAGPQTFVIGVDHFDPANQQLDANGNPTTPPGVQAKVFEYTDFFGRSVKIHQGDTLDFRFAIPDHLISVAQNEAAARQNGPLFTPPFPGAPSLPLFPLFKPDETTAVEGNAIGSGGPKIELGLAAFATFAFPPRCGLAPAAPCQFDGNGSSDAGWIPPGAPATPDWSVTINAPAGTSFTYFCHFHPGMRGTVTVVPNHVRLQTQAQIDKESAKQFRSARAQAMKLYNEANQVQAEQKNDGPTIYTVHVGVTSKDRHIAIHDMLPASLNLAPGDIVKYKWESNVIHTVGFTNVGPALHGPFGADCETSYVDLPNNPPGPACEEQEGSAFDALGFGEVIGDPGTTAPGSPLTTAGGADSGLLGGADYAQYYGPLGASTWSITASDSGAFKYKCTVHDWMNGTLTVSS